MQGEPRSGAGRPADDATHAASSAHAPAIVARDFTFQPTRDLPPPLAGLHLDVAPRSSLLVAGATGTGKSLLLNLLAGLAGLYPDPHAQGSLAVHYPNEKSGAQHERGPLLPAPRPGRVALVMQSPRDGLVGMDVLGALALPLEEQGLSPGRTRSRVEAALGALDLLHLAARDVATLSGGEARRVALAAALAQDAALLLLDEPFADLDPQAAAIFRSDLLRLTGTRTIVIAEHRTHLVADLVQQTLHLVPPPRDTAPDTPPPSVQRQRGPPPRIVASGLRVERAGRTLIHGLDLDLGPGVWGLAGPNGAGKSTLLLVLAGLLPPRAGDVKIAGLDVWRGGRGARGAARRERDLRRRLQVAFQDPHDAFFAARVSDELAAPLIAMRLMGRAAATQRVQETLAQQELAHLAERAPARLSAGEARIVQSLGALLVAPRVLFLDEPATGLDAAHRRRLRGLLARCAEAGLLVMVATHEVDVLPAAAGWIFLPGDGRSVVGDAARPGAALPRAYGYEPARSSPGGAG